jgi:hypothetical protein
MTEFKADLNIMIRACNMLSYLSAFEHLRKPIVDAKAVTALAAALDGHKNIPRIKALAGKALKCLV